METITLTLPEHLYEPIQRIARATHQPVETVLITALQASLPPLDGLADDVITNLTALETLDDDTLRQIVFETVPPAEQEEQSDLLGQQLTSALSADERTRLNNLHQRADLVMLRKARAAVLLRFRGQPVPTLAFMRQHMNAAA